ncbi:hypothetical protein Acr_13g0008400, partial [Actinidia rufa]
ALIYKYIVANVPVPSNLLIALKNSLHPYGLSGLSSRSYAPNTLGWGSFHLGFSGNTDPEPGSGASNSLGITQYQFKGLKTGAELPSADVVVNRMQVPQGLSAVSPTTDLKSKGYPFSIPKPYDPLEESSNSGFGVVSCESLLNPSQKNSFMNSTNYNPILDFSNCESRDQHPLRHFIDEWPKDQPNHATIAWPDELKSDWTQLSMSIPMASSDFSSTLPTYRMPISWESSMGGPLGEVLNSTSSAAGPCKKSTLNLTTRVWNGSPQLGSSPTGVLQNTMFVSLSNSSSGSSPRADKKQGNRIDSLSDDMLGSTLSKFILHSVLVMSITLARERSRS